MAWVLERPQRRLTPAPRAGFFSGAPPPTSTRSSRALSPPTWVVGFELRNVAAKYASERSHRFPLIEPNSGHRDNSRLRRCAECQMLARASVNRETVIWQFIRQNRLSNRVFKS